MKTAEEFALEIVHEWGDEEEDRDGNTIYWLPEKCDEDAARWLAPIIRAIQEDALRAAAGVIDQEVSDEFFDTGFGYVDRAQRKILALIPKDENKT